MIKFQKVFKLACLFIIFTVPAFSVAASSQAVQKLSLQSEKNNVEYVEYLEPIEFPELTAQPGQTISEEIRIRVKIHKKDGTSELGYETATFTLTNVLQGGLETSVSSQFVNPLMATYVTCYGSLNGTLRQYTVKVDWHFDGTKAVHDLSTATTFTASWPYSTLHHHPIAPGFVGPTGAPLVQSTLATFTAVSPWSNKGHRINWTLPHNSSNCTATGSIYDW